MSKPFSLWRYVASVETEYRLDYHGGTIFTLYVRSDYQTSWKEFDVFTNYAPNNVPPELKNIEAFNVALEILSEQLNAIEE